MKIYEANLYFVQRKSDDSKLKNRFDSFKRNRLALSLNFEWYEIKGKIWKTRVKIKDLWLQHYSSPPAQAADCILLQRMHLNASQESMGCLYLNGSSSVWIRKASNVWLWLRDTWIIVLGSILDRGSFFFSFVLAFNEKSEIRSRIKPMINIKRNPLVMRTVVYIVEANAILEVAMEAMAASNMALFLILSKTKIARSNAHNPRSEKINDPIPKQV